SAEDEGGVRQGERHDGPRRRAGGADVQPAPGRARAAATAPASCWTPRSWTTSRSRNGWRRRRPGSPRTTTPASRATARARRRGANHDDADLPADEALLLRATVRARRPRPGQGDGAGRRRGRQCHLALRRLRQARAGADLLPGAAAVMSIDGLVREVADA